MKISDTVEHVRTVACMIDEDEVMRILTEHVARQAGVYLDGHATTARGYYSTRDSSCGQKRDVKIEIRVDVTKLPTEA